MRIAAMQHVHHCLAHDGLNGGNLCSGYAPLHVVVILQAGGLRSGKAVHLAEMFRSHYVHGVNTPYML